MEKQYLDALYRRRWGILTSLEAEQEINTFPDDGCSVQLHNEKVRRLKEMLEIQDQNITDYMTFHR